MFFSLHLSIQPGINTQLLLLQSPLPIRYYYTTYKYSLLNADASTPPLGLSRELANPSDFTNLPPHVSSGMRNTYVTTRLPGASSSSNFAEIFAFPFGRRYEKTTVASFTETSNAEACSMRTRSLAPAIVSFRGGRGATSVCNHFFTRAREQSNQLNPIDTHQFRRAFAPTHTRRRQSPPRRLARLVPSPPRRTRVHRYTPSRTPHRSVRHRQSRARGEP